mgnify:CR=1 FL=1
MRNFVLALLGLVGLAMLAIPVCAGQIGSLVVEAPSLANQGEEVTVRIVANGMDNVGALQLELLFDDSILEPISVEQGEATSNTMFTYNIENGKIILGFITLSGISGDGAIAKIKFKASGEGTSKLEISVVDATDTDNRPLSIDEVVNGTIRVTAGLTTPTTQTDTGTAPTTTATTTITTATEETRTQTSSTREAQESQTTQTEMKEGRPSMKTPGFELAAALAGIGLALGRRWWG